MSNKELSDLTMSRIECKHCGAVWINGVHRWSTGCTSPTSEADLAGLVCNTPHGDPEQCINPQMGNETGDTWQKRSDFLDSETKEMKEN